MILFLESNSSYPESDCLQTQTLKASSGKDRGSGREEQSQALFPRLGSEDWILGW